MSNKELAAAVDLAPSSVHERTKRLFETGIVAGAHADVSLERVGLAIKAMLLIQLSEHEKGNLKRFLEEISHIPEVRAAWMITGPFRYGGGTRDTRHETSAQGGGGAVFFARGNSPDRNINCLRKH